MSSSTYTNGNYPEGVSNSTIEKYHGDGLNYCFCGEVATKECYNCGEYICSSHAEPKPNSKYFLCPECDMDYEASFGLVR